MKAALTLIMILAASSLPSVAGPPPGALPRHSLSYSPTLHAISVGIVATRGKRDVELDQGGGERVLEYEIGYVGLGYDVAPWLTGYATLGAGRLRTDRDPAFADHEFRGGLGVNANFWRTDITHPVYLEGTISLRGILEYNAFSSTGQRTEYEWSEVSFMLPLRYESYSGSAETQAGKVYSLVLFGGPCFSSVDGDLATGGRSYTFGETESLGYVGGAELYFADNLNLGFQVLSYEDPEISVSLFYHF